MPFSKLHLFFILLSMWYDQDREEKNICHVSVTALAVLPS